MAVVTADYRLSLLGPPTMVRGGKSWALPFERRGQLVVWLALAGTWVGRRELAATLWPDVAGPLASNNLRKTLFRMPALPWGDAVASYGFYQDKISRNVPLGLFMDHNSGNTTVQDIFDFLSCYFTGCA